MTRAFERLWGGFNSGLHVGDPDTVWVAEDGGRIRHTRDGGTTWMAQATPRAVEDQLHSIFFLSPERGWACGRGEERETDTPATGIVLGYR